MRCGESREKEASAVRLDDEREGREGVKEGGRKRELQFIIPQPTPSE